MLHDFARFDFSDEPVNLWPEVMSDIRASGKTSLRTRVLWGAHEQVRGIRDFSKASRLRLEKFLALAGTHDLSVELEVGFFATRDSFPPWAYGGSHKALVPAGIWGKSREGYALVPLPSLFDPSIAEGFRAFLADVHALVSLYRKPEGPVARVILDLGVLGSDLNALESSAFVETLEKRYGDISRLNTLYQTTFKTFASVASRAGFRALMDRRPWLSAYDYQWCRREMLSRVCQDLLVGTSADWLEVSGGGLRPSAGAPWSLAVDAMMLEAESSAQNCFPFTPGGLVHPMTVASYRLGDYLGETARREHIPLFWLGEDSLVDFGSELLVVVTGKYLSRGAMKALRAAARSGQDLFFPFGLPQYDEWMARFDEFAPAKGPGLTSFKEGLGNIWIPAAPPTYGDGLWDELRPLVNEIRERKMA